MADKKTTEQFVDELFQNAPQKYKTKDSPQSGINLAYRKWWIQKLIEGEARGDDGKATYPGFRSKWQEKCKVTPNQMQEYRDLAARQGVDVSSVKLGDRATPTEKVMKDATDLWASEDKVIGSLAGEEKLTFLETLTSNLRDRLKVVDKAYTDALEAIDDDELSREEAELQEKMARIAALKARKSGGPSKSAA